MSVVANVVSPIASWVVYDGRGTKDGKIVSENIVKAQMVNESVCVGYTGHLEVAEKVLLQLKRPENLAIIPKLKSDDVARSILTVLQKSSIPESLYTQYLITGVNSSGKMATYTIDRAKTLVEYIPSASEPLKISVLSTGVSKLDITSYILHEIAQHGTNNRAIISGMKKFICDVADEDSSVNKNLSVIELRA